MKSPASKLLLVPAFVAVILACKKKDDTSETPPTPVNIKASVLVQNLDQPWEILWGPDNFIWMSERGGRIILVNPANGNVVPLLTIPEVDAMSEGGLLGMVLHPQFNTNPFVYVTYNYRNSSNAYREKVVRFSYNGTTLTNPQTLIENITAPFPVQT